MQENPEDLGESKLQIKLVNPVNKFTLIDEMIEFGSYNSKVKEMFDTWSEFEEKKIELEKDSSDYETLKVNFLVEQATIYKLANEFDDAFDYLSKAFSYANKMENREITLQLLEEVQTEFREKEDEFLKNKQNAK
jgi:hypothetical protein